MTTDEMREFCREWGPFRAAPYGRKKACVVAGDGDVILHVESSNAAHCMAAKDYAAAVAIALNEAGGWNEGEP
jgi:hypothetical protein